MGSTKAGRNRVAVPDGDTARFGLLFEYLQISPSYWLAEQFERGEIAREHERMPKDFAKVLQHYALLRGADRLMKAQWLAKIAPHLFGTHVIAALKDGVALDEERLQEVFADFRATVGSARDAAGSPGMAVLAIPLGHDRRQLKEQLGVLIDGLSDRYGATSRKSPFAFQPSKLSNSALFRLVELASMALAGRSLRDEGRRLAKRERALASLHGRLWPDADSGGPQGFRKLKDAYRIAENAARGVFPSTKPLEDESTESLFKSDALLARIKADDARVIRSYIAKHPEATWADAEESLEIVNVLDEDLSDDDLERLK